MDMSRFSKVKGGRDDTLKAHTTAIRENQVSVALMILYLHGYEVDLHFTGHPLADRAREAQNELSYEGIPVWSCSTQRGGIWETWQRKAIKTGTVDEAFTW